jgi:hypothetical protein
MAVRFSVVRGFERHELMGSKIFKNISSRCGGLRMANKPLVSSLCFMLYVINFVLISMLFNELFV